MFGEPRGCTALPAIILVGELPPTRDDKLIQSGQSTVDGQVSAGPRMKKAPVATRAMAPITTISIMELPDGRVGLSEP